jgi:xanthine/uracil permease
MASAILGSVMFLSALVMPVVFGFSARTIGIAVGLAVGWNVFLLIGVFVWDTAAGHGVPHHFGNSLSEALWLWLRNVAVFAVMTAVYTILIFVVKTKNKARKGNVA